MKWPNNIVEELAYRRCILFLGAGISATSKNDKGESPEVWSKFLNNVKSMIKNPSTNDTKFIEEMLSEKKIFVGVTSYFRFV